MALPTPLSYTGCFLGSPISYPLGLGGRGGESRFNRSSSVRLMFFLVQWIMDCLRRDGVHMGHLTTSVSPFDAESSAPLLVLVPVLQPNTTEGEAIHPPPPYLWFAFVCFLIRSHPPPFLVAKPSSNSVLSVFYLFHHLNAVSSSHQFSLHSICSTSQRLYPGRILLTVQTECEPLRCQAQGKGGGGGGRHLA